MNETAVKRVFDGRQATLEEILSAREERAMLQMKMLSEYGKPLVSFSMNIAGPVKNSPLIGRAFEEGKRMLTDALAKAGISVLDARCKDAVTGCELMYCVDGAGGRAIKDICVAIEDSCQLGRLFDMDVILPEKELDEIRDGAISGQDKEAFYGQIKGKKLERASQRKCLICGEPGRDCASRRIHSVSQLQEKTAQIITEYFIHPVPDPAEESKKPDPAEILRKPNRTDFENRETDPAVLKKGEEIAELVTAALMEEVLTTPKPGLVDRNNNGSHRDMDIDTFRASAEALDWFWRKCFVIGCDTSALSPEETFLLLRKEGILAEEEMLRATGGVNTHKGAIFLMGTVCGAIGRLWKQKEIVMTDREPLSPERTDPQLIAAECSRMTREILSTEYDKVADGASPQASLFQLGYKGARGEIADGLPGVINASLPLFREMLKKGADRNVAGAWVFLALVARGEDTNMIRRGGRDAAKAAAEQAGAIIARAMAGNNTGNEESQVESIKELDRQFIKQNLSPGGSADLLAITYFLYDYCECNLEVSK